MKYVSVNEKGNTSTDSAKQPRILILALLYVYVVVIVMFANTGIYNDYNTMNTYTYI